MIKKNKICISGGMDPIHIGHIRMIREASEYGDVIVILNSDDWLIRKKGFYFMTWDERYEILMSIKGVSSVESVNDNDGTVCEALIRINPDYFANGGDRFDYNTPESSLCSRMGIKMIWGVGGEKIQSSSELINKYKKNKDTL